MGISTSLSCLLTADELTERGWVHEATGTMYKKCSKLFDTFKESYSGAAVTMTVVLATGAFMFLIFITILMGMGGGGTWTS